MNEGHSDLMRLVNDSMRRRFGGDEMLAFFCECDDGECYQSVWLSTAEYDRRRANPFWVAVSEEHVPRVAA